MESSQDITDSIWISASLRDVFDALTQATMLARWWPMGAESDARPGGRLKLLWFNATSMETTFDVFDPPAAIAFRFGNAERIRFGLTSQRGGTLFHVSHRCGVANAIHVAQAWAFLKANLKSVLEHGIDLRDKQ